MEWRKLYEMDGTDKLFRGTIIRTRSLRFGKVMDYMIVQESGGSGLGLVHDSGYDAGVLALIFPAEAKSDSAVAISIGWLKSNWNEWIGNGANLNDAWILKGGRVIAESLPDE